MDDLDKMGFEELPQEELTEMGFEEIPQKELDDLGFEPAEDIPQPVPEFKPEGSGFLGATMDTKFDPQALVEGTVEAARNVPVAGPLVEKGVLAASEAISPGSAEEFQQRREQAAEDYPGATTLGGIGGSMAGFGVIGKGLGALTGAPLRAGLGLSAADMASKGVDAKTGAGALALEAGLGGGLKGISKLKNLKEILTKKAGKRAEAAAGLDATKSLRDNISKLETTGKIKEGELGNRLLDQGVVQAGDTADNIARKALDNKKLAGKEIEGLLADASRIPVEDVQKAIQKELPNSVALNEFQQKLTKKLNTQIDILEEAGETLSANDLNKAKSEIGREVKDFLSDAPNKEAGKKIYKAMTTSIENSLGEAQLERLRAANKKYQALTMAEDAATSQAGRGPSEMSKSMALYGAATGNPLLPSVVASKSVWNKYGNALMAAGLKKGADLGKHVEAFARAAEKGTPSAIGTLHFQLMQSDEAYRKRNSKKEGK
jgi:predicted CopG family antitoxin